MPRPRKLNPREENFVLEYCLDWDHRRAALAAGYPSANHGIRLLKLRRIWELVEYEREARRERLRVDADRITEEFAKVGYANARDYVPAEGEYLNIKRLNSDQTAAIEDINVEDITNPRTGALHRRTKIKLYDKIGALNSLAKSIGMLAERHIMEGTIEHLITQMTPEERLARIRQLREKAESVYLPQYERMLEEEGKLVDHEGGGEAIGEVSGRSD